MEGSLYKIDLHIHTPASKCYQGPKTDDEYIQILKRARENSLDIIAITDHNSIDGYMKLIDIYHKTQDDLRIIERYRGEANPRIEEDIKKDEEIINLFHETTILPGIEITLNPKVHMIVITSCDKVNDLRQLLDDIGYTSDKQGIDNGVSIDVDVKKFLSNQLLVNKIVIAPHVDSDCGIYNELSKSGTYRADIMKSPMIDAMTCNNIEQLKKIKSLIANEPLYKRDTPIAFINSSDAHCTDMIGSRVSYVKVECKTAEGLKKAFKSPESCIFDMSDNGVKSIINRLMKVETSYVITDFNMEDSLFLAKCLCACLNEGIRVIIFGVSSENGEIIGIKLTYEEMKSKLLSSFEELNFNGFIPRLAHEPLGNGRNVYFMFLDVPKKLFWYFEKSQETYILASGIKRARLCDVEKLINRNTLFELKEIEERNNNRVSSMITNINSLTNMAGKLAILQRIESSSIYLSQIVEVEVIEPYKDNDKELEDIFKSNIGDEEGDTFYIFNSSVRLDEAILRYSCPITNFDLSTNTYVTKHNGCSFLISYDGGTQLIEDTEWSVIGKDNSFLCVKLNKEDEDNISIYSLIGWFKSSLFIWYTLRKFDTTNLFIPFVFRNIFIPNLNCLKPEGIVEKYVKQIIEYEREFVRKFKKMENESYYNNDLDMEEIDKEQYDKRIEELNKVVDTHNDTIEKLVKEIDEVIITELRISGVELEWISNEIVAEGIYNILDI